MEPKLPKLQKPTGVSRVSVTAILGALLRDNMLMGAFVYALEHI